jgi:sterol desaturase/sphingolipid hydroxylase (fatty acid hydroxylase superfamily)
MSDRTTWRRGTLGWATGVASTALGAMGLGAVLCLWFPALLTTPELRQVYDMRLVRPAIAAALALAFVLGAASLLLKRRKWLGLTGIGLSLAATLMGGSEVEVASPVRASDSLGLDWFLLNLLILATVFVPIEQLFARWPQQKIFRRDFATDLGYFAVSHLGVQTTVLLTLAPAALFFRWAVSPALQACVAGQPFVVQFAEILLIADLTQYAVHRLFHRVPWLWRVHAIHHSSRELDWLAGSRLHLVDVVVTRAAGFVPIYVLGFATAPTYAYLVFVSFQAVLIHANLRFGFGWLAPVFATPRFHHWHHSPDVVDVNFAVHLPIIDRVFGTYHLPRDAWPTSYGIAEDPIPPGYLRQLVFPFLRGRTTATSHTPRISE